MMDNSDISFAEFKTFKKITNPKEREKTKRDINNPYTITGFDRLRVFYDVMGLDFDEEFYNKIIDDYSNFE